MLRVIPSLASIDNEMKITELIGSGHVYCARTDEVSRDVGPLHLERAAAAGELRAVGDIGGGVERGVVEADEVAVLGGLDVRLDEVGALVDGAGVCRRRLLRELAVGAPVRDVEGARRLQRRPVVPPRPASAFPDQRPRRDAARATRRDGHGRQHGRDHSCTQNDSAMDQERVASRRQAKIDRRVDGRERVRRDAISAGAMAAAAAGLGEEWRWWSGLPRRRALYTQRRCGARNIPAGFRLILHNLLRCSLEIAVPSWKGETCLGLGVAHRVSFGLWPLKWAHRKHRGPRRPPRQSWPSHASDLRVSSAGREISSPER
jgi:hypothetical protein